MRGFSRRIVAAVSLAHSALAEAPAAPQTGTAPAAQTHENTAAERDDGARAEARALFDEANARARRGEWSEALTGFVRSDALHPHAVTVYNIGYCERALGHYTRARSAFRRALADHEDRGAVEMPDDMVTVVRGYLSELDRRVARVTVTVTPSGAALAVDGRPLEIEPSGAEVVALAGTRDAAPGETVPAGTFALLIDPGAHVFSLSLAGHSDRTLAYEVSPGIDTTLSIAMERPSAPAAATTRRTRTEMLPPERHDTAKTPVAAYVAFAVGGLGIVTGSILGGIAFARTAELGRACPGRTCTGENADALDNAQMLADVATAAFVTGGAGAALGAALWLANQPSRRAPSAARVTITPVLGLASVGLDARF